MGMLKRIDDFLNTTTMYRVVLYGLVGLIAAAMVLGFFGLVPYNPIAILFSTLLITTVCWIANKLFAWAFDAPTNVESVYITALILALIVSPLSSLQDPQFFPLAIWASLWAIASKYILAVGKKHVFNPAAFAVALTALTIGLSASWWVATPWMAPFVLVAGFLIVRKIQRTDLIVSFIIAALAATVGPHVLSGSDIAASLGRTVLNAPLLFFAFVMLTEPLTTPPQRWLRIIYGALVGFLFAPWVHLGSIYSTPELALLVGNLFSYLVSPKEKLMLTLKDKVKVAADSYDFVFRSDRPLSFRPGQYMEWTLPHAYPDNGGNRRYFTIASSPTEKDVRLGLKFYYPASSFKRTLAEMGVGERVVASQLAGDFILPRDPKRKLVFIAGGIGITPFRSMIQYLLDRREPRPITLFYSNKTANEIAYKDVFDRAARELGMRTVYALTDEPAVAPGTHAGRIDAALIARTVPDYRERIFYLSGPRSMVNAFEKTLRGMGIPGRRIKTDFFPGFA